MMKALGESIPDLVLPKDDRLEKCLQNGIGNQVYEHVCGVNRIDNFENALLFFVFLTQNSPAKFEKKMAKAAKYLLERKTVSYTHLTLPTIYSV